MQIWLSTAERKTQIVGAALRLARESSPALITTGDIAAAIGVTQGTMLKHFATKDAVWLAAMRWVRQTLLQRLLCRQFTPSTRTSTHNSEHHMHELTNKYRDLTQSISAGLSPLRASTPEVMKSFSELGRAATATGALDAKTKELIALALSVAARCDPCIGFHTKALVKLGATRQELDETLGVTTYMGGGPSLMYAAHAIAAFEEFAKASATKAA